MVAKSFRRGERLSKRSQIRLVLKSQRRSSISGITLMWEPRKAEQENQKSSSVSRFCVVVAKKIVENAVQRNHLRRLAKEFFRLNKNRIQFPVDIVIRISSCNAFNYNKLSNLLESVFKKAGLICG